MQITVASSRVRVVVMNIARRLPTQIFKGAMLTGIAFFAGGLIAGVGCKREFIVEAGTLPDGARSAKRSCEWVPFAYAPACYATSAKTSHLKKKVKVWKFVQRNPHGNAVLIFNDSAIKYTFSDQNVSWISSAPTWNVCIFNPKANRGMLKPLEYCIVRQNDQVDYGISHEFSKTRQLFQSRPATKIAYRVDSADPVKEKVEMMYQTGSHRASTFSTVELLFSDWIKVTPQVQHVLNGLTRMSKSNGIMLEKTHVYPGGRRHKVLSTDSLVQCEVPASEFDYPTGWKHAAMKEIMEEHEKARQMSGVFEELLFDPAPIKGTKGATGK